MLRSTRQGLLPMSEAPPHDQPGPAERALRQSARGRYSAEGEWRDGRSGVETKQTEIWHSGCALPPQNLHLSTTVSVPATSHLCVCKSGDKTAASDLWPGGNTTGSGEGVGGGATFVWENPGKREYGKITTPSLLVKFCESRFKRRPPASVGARRGDQVSIPPKRRPEVEEDEP